MLLHNDALGNEEILYMLDMCHAIISQGTNIQLEEADLVYNTFYPLILAHAENTYFVAQVTEKLYSIYKSALSSRPPSALNLNTTHKTNDYQRFLATDL